MSLVTWVLFESFYALAAGLALSLYVLLVYWRRSGKVRPLLIGLVAASAMLVMQQVVVTQREHAGRILRHIEQDIERHRVDALRDSLSATFAADRYEASSLVAAVEQRLKTLRISNITRNSLEVTASDQDRFTVRASYTCDLGSAEMYNGPLHTRWDFGFTREGGLWKLNSIDNLWVETLQFPLTEALR